VSTSNDIVKAVQEAYEQGEEHPTIGPAALKGQVFENETLHCLTFDNMEMEDVVFNRCDLRGSDFATCKFSHVVFHKCLVYGTVLPSQRNNAPAMVECVQTLCQTGGEEATVRPQPMICRGEE